MTKRKRSVLMLTGMLLVFSAARSQYLQHDPSVTAAKHSPEQEAMRYEGVEDLYQFSLKIFDIELIWLSISQRQTEARYKGNNNEAK